MDKVQVAILCGGQGMRIREETEFKPKPMISIGERPIIWHIMKYYAHFGFKDFILCLGYKGHVIKEYFLNYETMVNDFTVELGDHKGLQLHNSHPESGWSVTLSETGINAMTGARLKRIQRYFTGDYIMLTYGDGLSDVNLKALLEFHKSHGKVGTVTGVTPSSRFGDLIMDADNKVKTFSEKPHTQQGRINGGFFVFDKRIFNYVEDKDGCIFERAPLEKLATDGELMVYSHDGFWQCMDTVRDMALLVEEWNKPKPAWKVWED